MMPSTLSGHGGSEVADGSHATMSTMANLRIEPEEWLADEVPRLTVSGLRPGEEVRISASQIDLGAQNWSSSAILTARPDGTASTDDPAVSGTYTGQDEAGLFWSMRSSNEGSFYRVGMEPIATTFEASVGDRVVARAGGRKVIASAGVRRTEVDEEGLRGVLFEPAGPSRVAVMTLGNGSAGGVAEMEAAVLASRGFTAFALAVFKYPGRPEVLFEIPLEYCAAAGEWLRKRHRTSDGRCAVLGISRTGELALLLGATFPELFGAIIAIAPSSQVWGAYGATGAAWTFKGAPIEFMTTGTGVSAPADLPRPIRFTPLFERAMQDGALVAATAIPVERADAPILLLSGAADAVWPSATFSELVVARLRKHGYPRPFRHITYPNAGHDVGGVPNRPVVTGGAHPVTGIEFDFGGTAVATAAARRDSWTRRLNFLNQFAEQDRTRR